MISDVTGKPTTNGMSRSEFKEFYEKNYGKTKLDFKLNRVDRRGCSSIRDDLSNLLNISGMVKSQLIEEYCHKKHFF